MPETVADRLADLPARAVALGVRLRRRRVGLVPLLFQGYLLPSPQTTDLVDDRTVGRLPEIERVKLGFSFTPALDLEDAQERDLHQVVGAVGHPGRADPGHGAHQLRAHLGKILLETGRSCRRRLPLPL